MKNPQELILDQKISQMRSSAGNKREEKFERESNLSIWLPALGVLFCTAVTAFLYLNLKKPNIQPVDFGFFALQILFLGSMISNALRIKKALAKRMKETTPTLEK